MTKTGTQNRPYTAEKLVVHAIFAFNQEAEPGRFDEHMDFDWNNREQVREFAARSDRHIRAGGSTELRPA